MNEQFHPSGKMSSRSGDQKNILCSSYSFPASAFVMGWSMYSCPPNFPLGHAVKMPELLRACHYFRCHSCRPLFNNYFDIFKRQPVFHYLYHILLVVYCQALMIKFSTGTGSFPKPSRNHQYPSSKATKSLSISSLVSTVVISSEK